MMYVIWWRNRCAGKTARIDFAYCPVIPARYKDEDFLGRNELNCAACREDVLVVVSKAVRQVLAETVIAQPGGGDANQEGIAERR